MTTYLSANKSSLAIPINLTRIKKTLMSTIITALSTTTYLSANKVSLTIPINLTRLKKTLSSDKNCLI